MGTRNLTMVINQEGEKKVAQYGQWDGYPSVVGLGVLNFLKRVRFLDEEGIDKELVESYNKNVSRGLYKQNQPLRLQQTDVMPCFSKDEIERINKYARHQYNRGKLDLPLVCFEDWVNKS